MYAEHSPTEPDEPSSPAREDQSTGTTKLPDHEAVSGPVQPPAELPAALRKPSKPPRTPEEKARDDAKEIVRKANEALVQAETNLLLSTCHKTIKRGREVLIARLERMGASEREGIIGTLGGDGTTPGEIEATEQYHTALVEQARILAEIEARKQTAEGAKKQDEKS